MLHFKIQYTRSYIQAHYITLNKTNTLYNRYEKK